jgi:glycosyltransferase involved in cell wall biosynthesis
MKIAIITSSQHAIPHGGVGQFTKSITELLHSFDHEVHYIFDKKPTNKFLLNIPDRYFYNSKPLTSGPQENIYTKQCVDHLKIENFRTIIQSMDEMNYDLYLINTPEAFDAISQVKTNAKVILYTHLFNQVFPEQADKSVFSSKYVEYFNSFLKSDSHIVATQSEKNKQKLLANGTKKCVVLPMPLTEPLLLESSRDDEKSGVLFIGTFSPGKNAKAYVSVMKKLSLPCKIMTNSRGKIKFEKKFKEVGITNYDIRVGITGKEKVDFIKSCKVLFHPSLFECYPYTFLECVGHMPVVVLDKQIWSENFESIFYHKTTVRQAHKKILELYNSDYNDDGLVYINQIDANAKLAWQNFSVGC